MAKTDSRTDPNQRTIASNRKARYDYSILDLFEAGIVLQGSEVKSMREGQIQIADAFARVVDGQVWLDGVHIPPYAFANGFGSHQPDRPRKLLMHRDEISRIHARVQLERLSLIPVRFYFRDGRVKVELALAVGRKKADKRNAMAERDSKREIERALGRDRKGRD